MLGWSRVTGWPDYTVKVGSIKGPTQKRTALPSSIFENFDFCPLRLLGSRAEKKKSLSYVPAARCGLQIDAPASICGPQWAAGT